MLNIHFHMDDIKYIIHGLRPKIQTLFIFAEVRTQEFKLQESGTREYITCYSIQ